MRSKATLSPPLTRSLRSRSLRLPQNHVVHHSAHYYVAGKNAIPEMTAHSPKHYADTKAVRPCVVKVTHAMGSLGIFVIRDDDEEKELLKFLEKTGQSSCDSLRSSQ